VSDSRVGVAKAGIGLGQPVGLAHVPAADGLVVATRS